MPLWLETVLSRQRSTASLDDIEAQKGDASFSSRSAALRANSSRLANMLRLGSSLTTRQNSADTASDDQVNVCCLCNDAVSAQASMTNFM